MASVVMASLLSDLGLNLCDGVDVAKTSGDEEVVLGDRIGALEVRERARDADQAIDGARRERAALRDDRREHAFTGRVELARLALHGRRHLRVDPKAIWLEPMPLPIARRDDA